MSIADQITRIKQLRNNIASKLWELRITEGTETDTSTLTLQECKDVIDTMGGTLLLDTTNLTNVAKYKYVQVNDPNLAAYNIKKDVSILGIRGLYDNSAPVPVYDSTCNIIYGIKEPPEDVYNPAAGTGAFPAITFAKPADGCTNMTLRPENIKSGKRILGVNGIYNYNTMNIAYSNGFEPSTEGNFVGVNGSTVIWALYDLNNNYIPPNKIATNNIQIGKIVLSDTSLNFTNLSKGTDYIMSIDFKKQYGLQLELCRKSLSNNIKKYSVVASNSYYKIVYYYDNNNQRRAYFQIFILNKFYRLDEPDFSINIYPLFFSLPYHVEIRW